MVGVAQLAERQVVVLDVVGSSPIAHPIFTVLTCDYAFRVAVSHPPQFVTGAGAFRQARSGAFAVIGQKAA